ncbi:MAG: hypothetical protein AAFX93_03535 [Verrucomicrobiota bacterium]
MPQLPAKSASTPSDPENSAANTVLDEWEHVVIETFVHAAQLIGIPKSVGQIYGLLFCREVALPMDSIMETLGISKGSGSMGLKTLRQIGAVKVVFVVGDRRDHYIAELKLRKLVSGFISEQVRPHLDSGSERLDHLEKLVDDLPEGDRKLAESRLEILRSWHGKTAKVLPVIQKFL